MKHRRLRHQNGSLTTEERSNGRVWIFRWRETSHTGKPTQRKVTIGPANKLTKTQAHKKAQEYRPHMEASHAPNHDSVIGTVAELVAHYIERELGEESGKAEKPRKAYRYIYTNYVLPRWGSLPLRAVKAVEVEAWLKTLTLANGSKAKVREVFGAAFRHGIRHEIYPINPIASVRQARGRATEPDILEPAEIKSVLRELDGIEPVRTAFLIAATTGMRRGEVFGLQWRDIDLERAIVHIRRSYVDGVEGPPKTESSRRPLPLPPEVCTALEKWKRLSKFTAPENWVFASEATFGKQPLWPATLWRRNVAPALHRAGINKRLGWHSLRRTYASLLLHSGANVRIAMELMRHSTAEMTLSTYAQSVGDEKREAGARIALMLIGSNEAA